MHRRSRARCGGMVSGGIGFGSFQGVENAQSQPVWRADSEWCATERPRAAPARMCRRLGHRRTAPGEYPLPRSCRSPCWVERVGAARTPNHQGARQPAHACESPARHHLKQGRAGLASQCFEIHINACERRPGRLRHHVPIVEADDRYVRRHGEAHLTQGLDRPAGDLVVAAKKRVRRGLPPREKIPARPHGPQASDHRPGQRVQTMAGRPRRAPPGSPCRAGRDRPRTAPGPVIEAIRLRPRRGEVAGLRGSLRLHRPARCRKRSGSSTREKT